MMEFTVVSGSDRELKRASEIVAGFVGTDITEPTPTNPDAWLSDVELRWKLEKPLGHHKKRWDWVYSICIQAAAALHSVQAVASSEALVLLMALCAARQIRPLDFEMMKELIVQIRLVLDKVRLRPRLDRLRSLFMYHQGEVATLKGDYYWAVQLLLQSAEQAREGGDEMAALNCERCASVYRFWSALKNGEAYDLHDVKVSAKKVVDRCSASDDPLRRFWALGNAPVHVFLSHIWTRTEMSPGEQLFWHSLFDQLKVTDIPGYNSILSTIEVIEAGIGMLDGLTDVPRILAVKVIASGPNVDEQACMTAHWVLANMPALPSSEKLEHLKILAREGHAQHHLRAVVQRELLKE